MQAGGPGRFREGPPGRWSDSWGEGRPLGSAAGEPRDDLTAVCRRGPGLDMPPSVGRLLQLSWREVTMPVPA